MAITRAKKQEIISKLSNLAKKADLLIFLGFRGLSVAKASELRRKLRKVGASYVVAKKRLAQIVLKNAGVEMPKLGGEVAFIFSGGELAAGSDDSALAVAKEAHVFAKWNKEASILGGVFSAKGGSASGGQRQPKFVDASMITRLAQIPSREVLVAQVVGVLEGPIRGLLGVLNGSQRGLVIALKQIAQRK